MAAEDVAVGSTPGAFYSRSPVGYASECTTLCERAIDLIDDMVADELAVDPNDRDYDALMALEKDRTRFRTALDIMYSLLRD